MSALRRVTPWLSLVVLLAGSACSSAEDTRPAAASAGDGRVDVTAVTERCTPGEVRECHQSYLDDRGQLHCPISAQECDDTGTSWSTCGAPLPSAAEK